MSAAWPVEHHLIWWSYPADRSHGPLGGLPVALSDDTRRSPPISISTTPSDEALMGLYRGGDQAAFRKLYDRYRGPLDRFVSRMALAPSDVDEIVQETWMAVIRGRERYVANARFVTYLFSIARRRSVDRWRRRGRHPEADDMDALEPLPGPSRMQPESLVGDEALGTAIAAAIEALPLPQREAFLLRAETDLTLEEIAQVTGTTRETAKSRLRYGVRRLRAALEPWT